MPSSEETAEQPRVIGVHGAVEQHASATRALSEALTGAENAGAAIDLFDLAELTLPLYNPDQPEPQDGSPLCAGSHRPMPWCLPPRSGTTRTRPN